MGRRTIFILASIAIGVGAVWFYRTLPAGESSARFAGVSLRIDYATTTPEQERGLGGRPSVPPDYGMLFVFPKDDYYGIWMRDMQVPIDVFWLDDKKRVIFMVEDMATSTYPSVFYPPAPARYVLETAAGFAIAHAVATGTPLTLSGAPF